MAMPLQLPPGMSSHPFFSSEIINTRNNIPKPDLDSLHFGLGRNNIVTEHPQDATREIAELLNQLRPGQIITCRDSDDDRMLCCFEVWDGNPNYFYCKFSSSTAPTYQIADLMYKKINEGHIWWIEDEMES